MAKAKKDTATVEEKLNALHTLQTVDSEIDRIRIIRGELPLEVKDLEDETEGLSLRLQKLEDEVAAIEEDILNKKNGMQDAQLLIKKYEGQQDKVRNNREYDSLTKEIEFQSLEIQLSDKRIKEYRYKIESKQEVIEETKEKLTMRQTDLAAKQNELDEIINETEKDEESLLKKSATAAKKIEDRLLNAYQRVRANSKNGLAVVSIERNSCGGCFNKIPPQRQLDIQTYKRIIVCEHCGRILVDKSEVAEELK